MAGAQTTALDSPLGPTKRLRDECARVGRPIPQKRGRARRIVKQGHSIAYVWEYDGGPGRKNGRLALRADAAHWVADDRPVGALPGTAALEKERPENWFGNRALLAFRGIQNVE